MKRLSLLTLTFAILSVVFSLLLIFRHTARDGLNAKADVVSMVLAAGWVEGQGLHLSANSINNLAEGLRPVSLRFLG